MSERRKKRVPAREKLNMFHALQERGYYDKNNNWNSLVTIPEYPDKVFRDRVEVLIFDIAGRVYLCKEKTFFRVPGGSTERDKSNVEQAILECKQEAKINICGIRNTGITYVRLFSKPYYPYASQVHWDGVRNTIYLANFKSWYDGIIGPSVRDVKMEKNGRFYKVNEIYNLIKPEFQEAIRQRFKHK